MDFFEKIKEKIQNLFSGNSKLLIFILGALGIVIILCICLAAVQCEAAKTMKVPASEATFMPSDDFLFADDNSLVQDYYYSRDVKEKWTQEEIDEWFTEVDPDAVKSLSKSNDYMINDLMGAAP